MDELEIHEVVERDGTRRLFLVGELDMGTAHVVKSRLDALADRCEPTRIDLARLEFIDTTGLHLFLTAIKDARERGWRLDIDPAVSSQTAEVFKISGLDEYIWPR